MVIDGKKLASKLLHEIRQKVTKGKLSLRLDILYIEKSKPSEIFIRKKKEASESVGISVNIHTFPENVSIEIIKATCLNLNSDPNCTGYLIQLPIDHQFRKANTLDFLDPSKDVDCLSSLNLGRAIKGGEESIKPATVEAIIHILKHLKVQLKSKIVTIVNDSNLIGKPLAAYLLSKGSTVSICNGFTKDLALFTKQADILVTATGQVSLINASMIKKGAVVLDAGITQVKGKTFGDVDFSPVSRIAKSITPVPGGVGPLTVACLLQNLLKLKETKGN